MSRSIKIHLPDELAEWLRESATRAGISQAQFVRQQLGKARDGAGEKPFMRLAGAMEGPQDLSQRKGFSRLAGEREASPIPVI